MSWKKLIGCSGNQTKERGAFTRTLEKKETPLKDDTELARRIEKSLSYLKQFEPFHYDIKNKRITYDNNPVIIVIRNASTKEDQCKQTLQDLIQKKTYICETLRAVAPTTKADTGASASPRDESFVKKFRASNRQSIDYQQRYTVCERNLNELQKENHTLRSQLWKYESRQQETLGGFRDHTASRHSHSTVSSQILQGKQASDLRQENEALKSKMGWAEKQISELQGKIASSSDAQKHNAILWKERNSYCGAISHFENEIFKMLRECGYQIQLSPIATYEGGYLQSINMQPIVDVLKRFIQMPMESTKALKMEQDRAKSKLDREFRGNENAHMTETSQATFASSSNSHHYSLQNYKSPRKYAEIQEPANSRDIYGFQSKFEASKREIQTLQLSLETKKETIRDLEQQINKITQQLHLASQEAKKLQDANKTAEMRKARFSQQLDKARSDLVDEQSKLKMQENQHQDELRRLTLRYKEKSQEFDRDVNQISLWQNENKTLHLKVKELEHDLRESTENSRRIKKDNKSLQQKLDKAVADREEIEKTMQLNINKYENEIAQLNMCLDQTRNESDNHYSSWKKAQQALQYANTSLKEQKSIEHKYEDMCKQVQKLKHDNKALEKSRNETQKQLQMNWAQIDELTVELTKAESTIESQNKTLNAAEEKLLRQQQNVVRSFSEQREKEVRALQQRNAELVDRYLYFFVLNNYDNSKIIRVRVILKNRILKY